MDALDNYMLGSFESSSKKPPLLQVGGLCHYINYSFEISQKCSKANANMIMYYRGI